MPRRTASRSGGAPAAVKPRRSHRKSRNGCAECKRRHIRCDKGQPVCFNCDSGDRTCVYPAAAHAQEAPPNHDRAPPSLPPEPPTPVSHAASAQDAQSDAHFGEETDTFSAMDLLLFHHSQTGMAKTGLGRKDMLDQVVAIAMRHRHRAPYLMDELLAVTALHLSMHFPPPPADPSIVSIYAGLTPESLRRHAMVRQTRAVAAFNNLPGDSINVEDPDGACTRMLFAGILSFQTLAEILSQLRDKEISFSTFVDSIVDCFNLHRGIHAATGQPIREFLRQSKELGPMMRILSDSNAGGMGRRKKPENAVECEPLHRVLNHSDLGEASLSACRAAVHSLQCCFIMCKGWSIQDGAHAVSAFAVTTPAGYAEALRKHCPEALIILAYYGLLLHRCREFWAFRDAGACLIRAVAEQVGAFWKDALSGPLEAIGSDQAGA